MSSSNLKKIKIENLLSGPLSSITNTRPISPTSSAILTISCNFTGCDRKFSSEGALQAHKRRTHPRPTIFKCPHCHESYSSPQNKNKHIRSVHEKIRPFQCDQCDKSFGFKDGLTRHIKTVHEKERPFLCPHCPMTFKTKTHLKNHRFTIHQDVLDKETTEKIDTLNFKCSKDDEK